MATCVFPGCKNPAFNNFGVRLRKPDTNAIFAPNTNVFFCDQHATHGVLITVVLEPT